MQPPTTQENDVAMAAPETPIPKGKTSSQSRKTFSTADTT